MDINLHGGRLLHDNSYNGVGVIVKNSRHVHVDNVNISDVAGTELQGQIVNGDAIKLTCDDIAYPEAADCEGVLITRSRLERNDRNGIAVVGSSPYLRIENVSASENNQAGINFAASSGTVAFSVVHGSFCRNNAAAGIAVGGSSNRIVLSSNAVYDNGGWGIDAPLGGGLVVANGNIASGNAFGDFNLAAGTAAAANLATPPL